mgnify:CR=1 FL=1
MGWLFGVALAVICYLVYQNYQLEKRWRCLRYCWQSMSDFAAEKTRIEGDIDEHWLDVSREQIAFMSMFGAKALTSDDIRIYELALLERNMPILTEHKIH